MKDTFSIIELAGGVPALHPERKGQLNRSPLKNWIEKNGGLPAYINSVATALLRENPGWSISRVIATAVNWAKKTCATGKAFGGKVSVSSAVKAAACTAVAQWEKKKASASSDAIDDKIIELASEDQDGWDALHAKTRKTYRERELEIPSVLNMSDEQYFSLVLDEAYELSGEGVEDMDNIEAFMEVMEMSAASQSAVRLPLNLSEASKVGDNKYRKELLRVGELVVNSAGKKFNFTSQFLKDVKNNFNKKVLDYVPMLFVDPDTNKHTVSANPKDYAGVVEELSVDDENNPTKLYGTLRLTDQVKEMVEHNPKFGVSVTAHPAYVDEPRSEYHGPMLLNVAATHYPKLNKMGEWERVGVTASDEYKEYEVIDLSAETYNVMEDIPQGKEGDEPMPENNTENTSVELSQEQISALLQHPDVKAAISSEVSSAVQEKDTQIANLSSEIGNIKKESYENVVKAAVNNYKSVGVPPVLADTAQALMLSFESDERNETIELSVGSGDDAKTLQLSKVQLVTRLLDETKGLLDLSSEQGVGSRDEAELSKEQEDEAVNFLLDLANTDLRV